MKDWLARLVENTSKGPVSAEQKDAIQLVALEQAFETARESAQQRADFASSAIRTVMLMNGGGLVALYTLGARGAREGPYLIGGGVQTAASVFVVGLICSAGAAWFYYVAQGDFAEQHFADAKAMQRDLSQAAVGARDVSAGRSGRSTRLWAHVLVLGAIFSFGLGGVQAVSSIRPAPSPNAFQRALAPCPAGAASCEPWERLWTEE